MAASACDDDKDGDTPPQEVKIAVNPTSIADFPAEGDTQTITVTATPANTEWTAVPTETWATVSKSGNTFTVTVGKNPGAERSNAVTVSAKDATPVVMNFKQAAAPVEKTLEISGTFEYPAEGGQATLTITSNTAWEITTTYNEGDDWLDYSAVSGTGNASVTVTAAENIPTARTAVIKVQAVEEATLFKTANVTQAAAPQTTLFIDELVGDWSYSGYFLQRNATTGEWSAYNDAHKLVITKIDDTSLKIDKVLSFEEGAPYHTAITATVDNTNKTISIAQQVFNGGTESFDEDGWDVYFTAYLLEPQNSYFELWGAGFTDIPVTGEAGSYKIDLQAYGVNWGSIGGVPVNSTFLPLTTQPGMTPSDDTVYWYSQVMAGVVWEQGYIEPAAAPRKPAKKAVVNPSFEKTMRARFSK